MRTESSLGKPASARRGLPWLPACTQQAPRQAGLAQLRPHLLLPKVSGPESAAGLGQS